MIGALMLDIAGTELTQEDIELLQAPQVGGMILFAGRWGCLRGCSVFSVRGLRPASCLRGAFRDLCRKVWGA